jgi:hypothetical protein
MNEALKKEAVESIKAAIPESEYQKITDLMGSLIGNYIHTATYLERRRCAEIARTHWNMKYHSLESNAGQAIADAIEKGEAE